MGGGENFKWSNQNGLTARTTFEWVRAVGEEDSRHGNSSSKGPEAGERLTHSRNGMEASTAAAVNEGVCA